MIDRSDDSLAPASGCAKWQVATLIGCREAGIGDRIRFWVHSIRCKECRRLARESRQVSRLMLASVGAANIAPVARPMNRMLVIALGVSLAGLALSTAFQYATREPDLASALSNEDCETTAAGPPARPEEDCEPTTPPIKKTSKPKVTKVLSD